MAPLSSNAKKTQDFVPIKEIRQGIAVLKDGSLRGILICSSLNFALKSADEQTSIIFQFQNFLNSLDFSVQIFIQSRRLDIRPYIALLDERVKEQSNDLMKVQTREYISFIKAFTENSNIMTKTFFVVVPYSAAVIKSSGIGGVIGKKKDPKQNAESNLASFEEHRNQLEQRMATVSGGLSGCGVRTIALGTEEIIELFYKIFNPGDTEKPIPLNQ